MAKFDLLQKCLIRYFKLHGAFVSRHPTFVLLLALVIAAVLSSGIMFLQFETKTEKLFAPVGSRAEDEKAIMEELFPAEYENFYASRMTASDQRLVLVIVKGKSDGSGVITDRAVREIVQLGEAIVTTVATDSDGRGISHETVCARRHGRCVANPVVEFWRRALEANSSIYIPMAPTMLPSGSLLIPQPIMANVTFEKGYIRQTSALLLTFYLKNTPPSSNDQSGAWEDAVADMLEGLAFQDIEVIFYTSDSVDESQAALVFDILPYFCATYGILTAFAVLSCLTRDWVAGKPWLANAGILSVLLATASTIGLLSFFGVPVNQVVASMPFLVLGIGLDDMFIMVSAWRRTNRLSSVEKRMSATFSEAAVSITITTLTDFLAFCIGSLTPLLAIRTFCLYTGVAVLLDFFFQITFFAAIMVFTGRREAQNRHCYSCREVLPEDQAPSRSYAIFCSGGVGSDRSRDGYAESVHACMTFFKKVYAPIITSRFVMASVAVIYALYLAAGIYGVTQITEGLELSTLAEEGSMTNQFFEASSEYFPGNCPFVTVIVTERLDYWDAGVQEELASLASRFRQSRYIQDSEFWLDDFKDFSTASNNTVHNRTTFLSSLNKSFLTDLAFERYALDINFDDDGSVSSSRFILTTDSLLSTQDEAEMLVGVREIADGTPLSVVVFAPTFIVFEQYLIISSTTFINLSVALVTMLLVSFLLIPSIPVAFLVTFCVLSIEVGVMGFMTFWGIALNAVSMINIILCIGFSVDFSAHVCYAVVAQEGELASAREKVANALYALGYPILQSGISTILALLPLLFTKSYIFQSFARIILLVMGFGVLHGLVVLPVVLTVIGGLTDGKRATEERGGAEASDPADKQGTSMEQVDAATGQGEFINESCSE